MREKFEYFLVVILIKLAKILPTNFLYFFFDFLAKFAFFALKSRAKIAIKNLSLAYPQKSAGEIKTLARENFCSVAKTLTQTLLFYHERLDFSALIANKDEALEKVKALKGDSKNSILFFTAHFGNWEVLAHFYGANGFPVAVVGRRGNNELIEDRLVTPFRKKYGNELIYKDDAMRGLVERLRAGKNVGILPDQKPGGKNSLKTTFFGRECYTTKTIASLYLKFNPVLIPVFARRMSDGRYEIVIKDFTPPSENLEKSQAEQFITQQCNDIFEEVVRSAPEQWFWMHNRWKVD